MRLIDAETLETGLANLRGVWTSWNNWKRVRAIIEDMPTVDPVRVHLNSESTAGSTKHGHWYYDPDKPLVGCSATIGGMFCSNCGGDCPTGSHPYRAFKYCPYCGAKMQDSDA